MDSGGYIVVYKDEPYIVFDEGDYFPVNLNSRQIAAFKTKADAVEYILWKKANVRDM